MTCEIGYYRCFTARRQEDHDVSRQHDGVKQASAQWRVRHDQIERREIAFIPWEVWGFATRHSKHGSVEVDPNHVDTTASQLNSHSAGATPGVEY
jgi:hypothetical protein